MATTVGSEPATILTKRVITAALGIPLVLAALYLGPTVFTALVAVLVFLALTEFYSLFRLRRHTANLGVGLVLGAATPFVALGVLPFSMSSWVVLCAVVLLVWKLAAHPSVGFLDVGLTLLGVVYVGFFLAHLVLLYNLQDGRLWVLVLIIGTWIADTAAYGVGRAAGRRRLAEKISPGKTVEGLIGALAANAILFLAFAFLPLSWWQRLILAVAISAAAVVGDLVESSLKRELEVKDSSNLLPGHGGILDRVDSMLLTSVAGFYLIRLLTGTA